MRHVTASVLVLIALASIAPSAQEPERLFKAAMNTEFVDGDLKRAIEQYAKVAAGGNRTIAAQALVRMAECHDKLGDAEAKAIYERVVREFGDQRDAVATARARLGRGGGVSATARGDRAVWTGMDADGFGTISPDGRFLTYMDWTGLGNVMVRDLTTGTSRPLTANTKMAEFGTGQFSVVSRDGERVAYEWNLPNRHSEVRIASLRGSGVPASRTVWQSAGDHITVYDWSPDGKWLGGVVYRADRSVQIGLVSVQDGTLRALRSFDWEGTEKVLFSPDGRFLAYALTDPDRAGHSKINVIAVDGSGETTVVDDASHNQVMAWAPDGQLVFVSDRTGKRSLWTMKVENGRPQSAPRVVKENVGSTWSLGLTSSGTLYVWQLASAPYVKVSGLDFVSGKLIDSRAGTFERFVDSRGRPKWSGDGSHLIFMSCNPLGGAPCTHFIRSSETGAVRQIPQASFYAGRPRLSPDGRTTLVRSSDAKGRLHLSVVDVGTGKGTLIKFVEPAKRTGDPEWSPDGRMIRYQERHDDSAVLVERALESEKETVIFRTPWTNGIALVPSPDGKVVSIVRPEPESNAMVLSVASLPGGALRELMRVPSPSRFTGLQWTTDNRELIAEVVTPGVTRGSVGWVIPISGTPRKLDIDMTQWIEGFSVSPDRQHIAFTAHAGDPGYAIWALENILPATGERRVGR
jgi:Tol biopolymer transport system component